MSKNEQKIIAQIMALLAEAEGETRTRKPVRRKRPDAGQILQLKISLKHIAPLIWRRVLVADNSTLGEMHDVIQAVMGWDGGHMHGFRIPARGFGQPLATFDNEQGNEQTTFLSDVLSRKGVKLQYEYDFGDGWEHDILLEKQMPFDATIPLPQCLAGARACPPEDCGGAPGYYDILEATRKPSSPESAELLEWLGNYDPEAFDLAAAQARLPHRRAKEKRAKKAKQGMSDNKAVRHVSVDPDFAPCPVDHDDEIFPNGIFEFNITKMLDYIGKNPGAVELIEMAVADLDSGFSSLNETHIETVDINRPVVLAEISPGRYNLIDGHHRVAKAVRAGVKTMPVRRLHFPQHVPFLVRRESYKTYIEYWNDKLKSAQKTG